MAEKQKVIAIGGGTLLCPENAKNLKSIGTIIYLQLSAAVVLDRIKNENNTRSYLDASNLEHSFDEAMKKRLISYETYADHRIDITGLHDHEVIQLTVSKLKGVTHGK